uniref:Uncharacterized protein n=1 Tax=Globisporangium ultimum (strain ATCC 200006 / CBS 805.95 / DAOM BR144) TaxID=431595 RepID=K3WRP5_GLOUD
MQRVASSSSTLVYGKHGSDAGEFETRDPERVWSEEVDGAWAPGKAPVHLLTALLQHVQDADVELAERTAQEILAFEPQNALVQDLLVAMKQRDAMESELVSASESDDESSSEESDSESGDDDENEDDARDEPKHLEQDEEKNNEEK